MSSFAYVFFSFFCVIEMFLCMVAINQCTVASENATSKRERERRDERASKRARFECDLSVLSNQWNAVQERERRSKLIKKLYYWNVHPCVTAVEIIPQFSLKISNKQMDRYEMYEILLANTVSLWKKCHFLFR